MSPFVFAIAQNVWRRIGKPCAGRNDTDLFHQWPHVFHTRNPIQQMYKFSILSPLMDCCYFVLYYEVAFVQTNVEFFCPSEAKRES